jgi:hypothetical protein
MNTGGSAFPRSGFAPEGVRSEDCDITDAREGMTLRDWFAGQALIGLMSDPGLRPDNVAEFAHMASRLYQVADAMLAHRELQ